MVVDHPIYDEKYFNWQKTVGEFGGRANAFKFCDHIKPTDVVLDFGCGGGYLLKSLSCARRIGVEVNPVAQKVAIENGVDCHNSIDSIQPKSVNVIISNHALEHVSDPLQVLIKLRSKLVLSGLLILVVPCESNISKFNPNDVNQHIYTWNPQLLGNLAKQAGYAIETVTPLFHKWPRNFVTIQKYLGWPVFHWISGISGRLNRDDFQVKLVARNLESNENGSSL